MTVSLDLTLGSQETSSGPASIMKNCKTTLFSVGPLICTVVWLCGCAAATTPPIAITTSSAELVSLDSPEGMMLLARNQGDSDLSPLLEHFESQQHRAHCGVASVVIALNALRVDAPSSPELEPFRYHRQNSLFLRPETAAAVSPDAVSQHGMTLDELGAILLSYGLSTRVVHGADITLDAFRVLLRDSVERSGDIVLVNYFRPTIGQEGGGHISPVAAYDADSDRVLILDVARYRYPPVWVAIEALWSAIRTVDSSSTLSRGIVEATVVAR